MQTKESIKPHKKHHGKTLKYSSKIKRYPIKVSTSIALNDINQITPKQALPPISFHNIIEHLSSRMSPL